MPNSFGFFERGKSNLLVLIGSLFLVSSLITTIIAVRNPQIYNIQARRERNDEAGKSKFNQKLIEADPDARIRKAEADAAVNGGPAYIDTSTNQICQGYACEILQRNQDNNPTNDLTGADNPTNIQSLAQQQAAAPAEAQAPTTGKEPPAPPPSPSILPQARTNAACGVGMIAEGDQCRNSSTGLTTPYVNIVYYNITIGNYATITKDGNVVATQNLYDVQPVCHASNPNANCSDPGVLVEFSKNKLAEVDPALAIQAQNVIDAKAATAKREAEAEAEAKKLAQAPVVPTQPTTTNPVTPQTNTSQDQNFLSSLWSQFSNSINNSPELPGLGTYGLGGGNNLPALPQNTVTSSEGFTNYAKGTIISGGAGFVTGLPAAELATAPFSIYALAGGTLANIPAATAVYAESSTLAGLAPITSTLTVTGLSIGAGDCLINGSNSTLCQTAGNMAIIGFTADPVSFTQMFQNVGQSLYGFGVKTKGTIAVLKSIEKNQPEPVELPALGNPNIIEGSFINKPPIPYVANNIGTSLATVPNPNLSLLPQITSPLTNFPTVPLLSPLVNLPTLPVPITNIALNSVSTRFNAILNSPQTTLPEFSPLVDDSALTAILRPSTPQLPSTTAIRPTTTQPTGLQNILNNLQDIPGNVLNAGGRIIQDIGIQLAEVPANFQIAPTVTNVTGNIPQTYTLRWPIADGHLQSPIIRTPTVPAQVVVQITNPPDQPIQYDSTKTLEDIKSGKLKVFQHNKNSGGTVYIVDENTLAKTFEDPTSQISVAELQFIENHGGQAGVAEFRGRLPNGEGYLMQRFKGVPIDEFRGHLTQLEFDTAIEQMNQVHNTFSLAHGDVTEGNILVETMPDGTHVFHFIDYVGDLPVTRSDQAKLLDTNALKGLLSKYGAIVPTPANPPAQNIIVAWAQDLPRIIAANPGQIFGEMARALLYAPQTGVPSLELIQNAWNGFTRILADSANRFVNTAGPTRTAINNFLTQIRGTPPIPAPVSQPTTRVISITQTDTNPINFTEEIGTQVADYLKRSPTESLVNLNENWQIEPLPKSYENAVTVYKLTNSSNGDAYIVKPISKYNEVNNFLSTPKSVIDHGYINPIIYVSEDHSFYITPPLSGYEYDAIYQNVPPAKLADLTLDLISKTADDHIFLPQDTNLILGHNIMVVKDANGIEKIVLYDHGSYKFEPKESTEFLLSTMLNAQMGYVSSILTQPNAAYVNSIDPITGKVNELFTNRVMYVYDFMKAYQKKFGVLNVPVTSEFLSNVPGHFFDKSAEMPIPNTPQEFIDQIVQAITWKEENIQSGKTWIIQPVGEKHYSQDELINIFENLKITLNDYKAQLPKEIAISPPQPATTQISIINIVANNLKNIREATLGLIGIPSLTSDIPSIQLSDVVPNSPLQQSVQGRSYGEYISQQDVNPIPPSPVRRAEMQTTIQEDLSIQKTPVEYSNMVNTLLEKTKGPIIEIGGPTLGGFIQINTQTLSKPIIVTNISDGLPLYNGWGSFLGTVGRVDRILDATHMNLPDGSVGGFVAAHQEKDVISKLLNESYRTLEPSGIIVLDQIRADLVLPQAQMLGFRVIEITDHSGGIVSLTLQKPPYTTPEVGDTNLGTKTTRSGGAGGGQPFFTNPRFLSLAPVVAVFGAGANYVYDNWDNITAWWKGIPLSNSSQPVGVSSTVTLKGAPQNQTPNDSQPKEQGINHNSTLIDQRDEALKNITLPNGKSMYNDGCGPTSITNILLEYGLLSGFSSDGAVLKVLGMIPKNAWSEFGLSMLPNSPPVSILQDYGFTVKTYVGNGLTLWSKATTAPNQIVLIGALGTSSNNFLSKNTPHDTYIIPTKIPGEFILRDASFGIGEFKCTIQKNGNVVGCDNGAGDWVNFNINYNTKNDQDVQQVLIATPPENLKPISDIQPVDKGENEETPSKTTGGFGNITGKVGFIPVTTTNLFTPIINFWNSLFQTPEPATTNISVPDNPPAIPIKEVAVPLIDKVNDIKKTTFESGIKTPQFTSPGNENPYTSIPEWYYKSVLPNIDLSCTTQSSCVTKFSTIPLADGNGNLTFKLDPTYIPDLARLSGTGLPLFKQNIEIGNSSLPYLINFVNDLIGAGYNVIITDGFRSYQQQQKGYNQDPAAYAEPGKSPHQGGNTFDIFLVNRDGSITKTLPNNQIVLDIAHKNGIVVRPLPENDPAHFVILDAVVPGLTQALIDAKIQGGVDNKDVVKAALLGIAQTYEYQIVNQPYKEEGSVVYSDPSIATTTETSSPGVWDQITTFFTNIGTSVSNFFGSLTESDQSNLAATTNTHDTNLSINVNTSNVVMNPNQSSDSKSDNFIYFSQKDPDYQDKIPTINKSTVAKDACGIFTGAMISKTDPEIYWDGFHDYFAKKGQEKKLTTSGTSFYDHKEYLESLGYKFVPISGHVSEIKTSVQDITDKGIPVWVNAYMYGFEDSAHDAVAIGVNNNKFVLNDPFYGQGEISDKDIDTGTNHVWRVFAVYPPKSTP